MELQELLIPEAVEVELKVHFPDGKIGGAGGSGIVIVKVPAAYTVAASPTPARALSTHPDGEQLVKFTASGTLTLS